MLDSGIIWHINDLLYLPFFLVPYYLNVIHARSAYYNAQVLKTVFMLFCSNIVMVWLNLSGTKNNIWYYRPFTRHLQFVFWMLYTEILSYKIVRSHIELQLQLAT